MRTLLPALGLLGAVACTGAEADKDLTQTESEPVVESDTDCDTVYYADGDGDGYGSAEDTTEACIAPDGYSPYGTDCDDDDSSIRPGAVEDCDEIDQDCDDLVDEGVTVTAYADVDEDGWGDDGTATEVCAYGSGWVDVDGDCDDEDDTVNPDGTESCDEVDEDCDGDVDEEAGSVYYADDDEDGYGDADVSEQSCDPVSGYVRNDDDCDDTSAAVNPDASDTCDGTDSDCDGATDEDAKQGWMLVTVDTNNDAVYELDPTSGAETYISTVDEVGSINSMDVAEDGTAIVHLNTDKALGELDACTGEVTEIGEHGAGNLCGIAFHPSGVLYGLDSTNDELVTLDLKTGAATTVGSLGFNLGNCGMAYVCAGGVLMGADKSSGTLFEVDPSTGTASNFVSTTVPFSSVGFEYDPLNQQLLGSTGTALYTIDPSTGTATSVGSTTPHTDDLAYTPVCP